MSVSLTNTIIQYAGTGTTGPYPIPFTFLENSWIRVAVLDASGAETFLTYDATPVAGEFSITGSNITTGVAYPNTHVVTVYRVVPLTQLLDLVYNTALPSQLAENALDKLTYITQQLSNGLPAGARALQFPISEPILNPTMLPAPKSRMDTVLYFNDTTGKMEVLPMDELAQRLLIILGAEAVLPYRVHEIGTGKTIDVFDSNVFLRVNAVADSQIILPVTEGFNQSFSMEVSRIGNGAVEFVPASGVIIDSMLDYRRIFGRATSVAVRPVALNRWQIYGDLY